MSTSHEQPAELERLVRTAIAAVADRSITLRQLLDAIAPPEVVDAGPPAVLPVAAEVTERQRVALDKVISVYGKVVPTERRPLTSIEVDAVVDEKETLDELKRMIETRHGNIRTTIFNALDVEAEASGRAEGVPRDKDGHYILDGTVRGTPSTPFVIKREVRNTAPTLNLQILQDLADDPAEEFSHEDFLAITSQQRVLDENKLLVRLKKNPRLIIPISKATTAGGRTASMNMRKA